MIRTLYHYLNTRFLISLCLLKRYICFSTAIRSALAEVFPEVSFSGCFFHWAQAVYRKAQSFGLAASYQEHGSTYVFLRSLLNLPLLPAKQIPDAFSRLCEGTVPPQVQALLDYVKDQWIEGTIPPREWSVFQRLKRSNNDIEGKIVELSG